MKFKISLVIDLSNYEIWFKDIFNLVNSYRFNKISIQVNTFTLKLSNTMFWYSGILKIIKLIKLFMNVTALYIDISELTIHTSQEPSFILLMSDALKKLENLQNLTFICNKSFDVNFKWNIAKLFESISCNLISLEFRSIWNLYPMNSQSFENLFQKLKQCRKLKKLKLQIQCKDERGNGDTLTNLFDSIRGLMLNKLDLYIVADENLTNYWRIMSICPQIRMMTSLQKLALELKSSISSITDITLKELAASIKNLSNIRIFHFRISNSEDSISDVGILSLTESLSYIKKIEEFEFSIYGRLSQVTDVGIKGLSGAFRQSSSLKVLNLYFDRTSSKITQEGFGMLMNNIRSCDKLEKFKFGLANSRSFIQDQEMEIFPRAFSSLKNLKVYDLELLSRENIILTSKSLKVFSTINLLENLEVFKLTLEGKFDFRFKNGFEDFFIGVSKIRMLRKIILSFKSETNIDFSDEALILFGNCMTKLQYLEKIRLNIDCHKMRITNHGLEIFAKTLKRLENLRSFNLEINNHSSKIEIPAITALVKAALGCIKLKKLTLLFFGGDDITLEVRENIDQIIDKARNYIKWNFHYSI